MSEPLLSEICGFSSPCILGGEPAGALESSQSGIEGFESLCDDTLGCSTELV